MRSWSSVQCPPPVEWGAEYWTPPRLCMSSCASTGDVTPQQALSTRAYEGPPLLAFRPPARSSLMKPPMPQYTVASIHTRYLRSLRLSPSDDSSFAIADQLSSPVRDTCTLSTFKLQPSSVTHRTWRTPPVSEALSANTPPTAPAQPRMS